MNRIVKILMVLVLPLALFAQNTITGTVTDAKTGNGLAGANVVVGGTTMGAAADVDGYFVIENVPDGTYTLTASVIGYVNGNATLTLPGAGSVDFALTASALEMSALEVFASRATRNTPVAYSDVSKADMELRLASQDIPMALNTTPSVYATMQGGGAGDARVNVRGFNQNNIAIMINGVPVNDMENGWVYWSNWDGVGDATSSIQMQRGLSAVNLATPSVGGTMNIITDPAAFDRGVMFKQEIGNDGFLKSTLNFNSGLINDKLAINGAVVRKIGDGLIDYTWTDAWAYYFGASYALTDADRIEFYAIGAPQRHGQNLYKQNIGVYDEEFAKSLDDYDEAALDKFFEVDRLYNETGSEVSSSYKGKQYFYMYGAREVDRYDPNFMNERENYYHKPQVNLNWYHSFSDAFRLGTTVYFSGGSGGGTGTWGSMAWDYSNPSRIVDYDGTLAKNAARTDGSASGILRNSVNRQWTIGAISKATYNVNENLKVIAGVDWRTAEVNHFYEVRDLLGADYLYWNGNDFDSEADYQKGLGDKFNYYETNTIDWLGGFAQAEYVTDMFSVYGTAGLSTIKYSFVDHFRDDGNGDEYSLESDPISGFQLKGGGLYNIMDGLGVFANFGYIEKVPIFDGVISDVLGTMNPDPQNEKITSVEGGVNFAGLNGMLTLNGNVYYTMWQDRANNRNYTMEDGTEAVISLLGMDQTHMGVELEAAFQPIDLFRLDAAVGIGNWTYDNDVEGSYKNYDTSPATEEEYTYYVKGLKIGDSPQTQIAFAASVFPVDGLQAQVVYKYYDRYYADWSPFTRTALEDGERPEAWQVPAAGVMDLHLTYLLPIEAAGFNFKVFAHVFNALDEVYIQDAVDNSPYNGWDKDHDADDAEVYFGLPRSFNVGLQIER
ncbi:TonB-dependent receptor [bacterium]|nr:TonB-dependent receptor [bacterium]